MGSRHNDLRKAVAGSAPPVTGFSCAIRGDARGMKLKRKNSGQALRQSLEAMDRAVKVG